MDHSRHTPLSPAELTEDILSGAPIYGPDDAKVGTISHLHGTDAVVDVGGFLGLGSKPVLVNVAQLNLMRDEDGEVHGMTSWTKEQLKELPEHHH